MGTDWYLVTVATEAEETALINASIDRATTIIAYFPDDPHLGQAKEPFTALPEASVAPWDGMAHALMVTAPLDDQARDLVKAWTTAPDLPTPLWQYDLLEEGEPFFRVSDFGVYLLRAKDTDLKVIQQMGISTDLWERVNLTGSVTAQPLTELDLKALKDELDPPS